LKGTKANLERPLHGGNICLRRVSEGDEHDHRSKGVD
jgi:hypothetical protein